MFNCVITVWINWTESVIKLLWLSVESWWYAGTGARDCACACARDPRALFRQAHAHARANMATRCMSRVTGQWITPRERDPWYICVFGWCILYIKMLLDRHHVVLRVPCKYHGKIIPVPSLYYSTVTVFSVIWLVKHDYVNHCMVFMKETWYFLIFWTCN